MFKAVGAQRERNEGHVRRIHSLEAESGAIAVEVSILDQIFDGLNHLDQNRRETGNSHAFKHDISGKSKKK